jgi:RNA polymerase sigma-70 factor (ECF subfamily)
MTPPLSDADARRIYLDAYERAVRHASLHVARAEALEVAHDVASALVRRREQGDRVAAEIQSVDAFVHRAVVNRLREIWRSSRRRQTAEREYHAERTSVAPAWARPDSDLESQELHTVIEATIAAMPEMQRGVFLLVRRDQRTYKEAAAALGIGVGTVHTHLSRANAALREAVADFQSGNARGLRRASARTIGTRP